MNTDKFYREIKKEWNVGDRNNGRLLSIVQELLIINCSFSSLTDAEVFTLDASHDEGSPIMQDETKIEKNRPVS